MNLEPPPLKSRCQPAIIPDSRHHPTKKLEILRFPWVQYPPHVIRF